MAEAIGAGGNPRARDCLALVSVVVPVFDGADELDRCLAAIKRSDWPTFECIVIDDASSDPRVTETITRHGVPSERMAQRSGPALARNAGVKMARGEIVFFIDADVLLHPDALRLAVAVLRSEPDVAAVMGSYDDSPSHGSLLSQYRNLFHHWNHQIANEEASTFWTGCGAIRRSVFVQMGGFSPDYSRPSIEDIELGYRMREAGHRIRLLKTMRATHLKRWTFWNMVKTDIFRRGVPWVALLSRHPQAPPDLNLSRRAKVATAAAALLPLVALVALGFGHFKALFPLFALLLAALFCARLTAFDVPMQRRTHWKSLLALLIGILMPLLVFVWIPDPWVLPPLALVALVVWTQRDFYRLLFRRGGFGFVIAAIPLQLVFFLCCALAVPLGYLHAWRQR